MKIIQNASQNFNLTAKHFCVLQTQEISMNLKFLRIRKTTEKQKSSAEYRFKKHKNYR